LKDYTNADVKDWPTHLYSYSKAQKGVMELPWNICIT